jgi:hypothetical protein
VDISAIRAALKTALDNVTGLTAYTYWPAGCSELPAAMPVPGPTTYGETFDDQGSVNFEVHLLAAWAESGFETGQALLDAFLDDVGASSVRAALEADITLGGVAEDVRVIRVHDYHFGHRMFPGGPPAWGVVFDVAVMAT